MITPTSPDWAGLKAWLLEQIADQHLALEQDQPSEFTNLRRGRIAMCRRIIEVVEPEHTEGDESPDYSR